MDQPFGRERRGRKGHLQSGVELLRFSKKYTKRPPGHANGRPAFYFRMDLFGLDELRGGGNWDVANDLLSTYIEEDVLEDLDLVPDGVIPVGAGRGMRDLFLLVREGWPSAGQVSWIDGEEIGRFPDFAGFMAAMTAENQTFVERLRNGEADRLATADRRSGPHHDASPATPA